MTRKFDFPYLGEYGPGPTPFPGQRWMGHMDIRSFRAKDKRLGRFGFKFQQLRTFDWAFAQSGMIATPERNLRFD